MAISDADKKKMLEDRIEGLRLKYGDEHPEVIEYDKKFGKPVTVVIAKDLSHDEAEALVAKIGDLKEEAKALSVFGTVWRVEVTRSTKVASDASMKVLAGIVADVKAAAAKQEAEKKEAEAKAKQAAETKETGATTVPQNEAGTAPAKAPEQKP